MGHATTIHACIQLEHYKVQVDEKSHNFGEKQCLTSPDGFNIPLNIRQCLPYLDIRPPTDHEFNTLTHVILTSDVEWDLSVADHEYDLLDDKTTESIYDTKFDPQGNYIDINKALIICPIENDDWNKNFFQAPHFNFDDDNPVDQNSPCPNPYLLINHIEVDPDVKSTPKKVKSSIHQFFGIETNDPGGSHKNPTTPKINSHQISKKHPDYESLRPNFGWVTAEIV